MRYCGPDLRTPTLWVLFCFILWLLGCILIGYSLWLVYDFSNTYDTTLRSRYRWADLSKPREDVFEQSMFEFFQKHDMLQITGCNEFKSQCHQFIQSAMSYVLDRAVLLRSSMSFSWFTWVTWSWVVVKRAVNNLEIERLKVVKAEKEKSE